MSQPSSFGQVSGPRKGRRAEAESIDKASLDSAGECSFTGRPQYILKQVVKVPAFDISVSFTEAGSEREVEQSLDELSSGALPTRRRRGIGRQGRDSSNVGSRLLPALPGTTAHLPGDDWDIDSFEECLMLRKQHHDRHVVNSCGALLQGAEPKAEEGDNLQMVEESRAFAAGGLGDRQMLDDDVAGGAVDTESNVFSARSKALGQARVSAPGRESNASTAEWLSANTMVDEVVQHDGCFRNQERAVAHADHCAASRPKEAASSSAGTSAGSPYADAALADGAAALQDGGRQFLAGVKRGPRDIPDSSRVRMASVVPGAVSEIRGSRSAGPSQPLVAWDMEPMSLATSNTSDTSVASNSSAGRQRAKRGSGVAAFFSQGANLSKGFSNLSLGRDRDGFADSAEIDPDTLPNDLLGAP
eukprot:CAMPEP_0203850294 /NCGR_PEP_ID=MMETSP0359-20131031/6689_1 /ASSEMBLY_ACC=CAM_ASM_000338 /TAXON_ID=268821 /ORGANISM="Scrippsiella Hangoei, Strain SHTV-5" /LENGTH=416 /DNA_ID=CAMNT_0050766169 /DNA_START=91 /DNA_END=1343 /DNA_ORIENTATION=-